MSLKEEMLEHAGIYSSRKNIKRLIENGAYFNEYLAEDLRSAVREGVITERDANLIKRKVSVRSKIDIVLNGILPTLKEEVEERISYLEDRISGSDYLTESEDMGTELEKLESALSKIEGLLN